MQYRKDIDGLRALAVISVIIYHMNSSIITGGFLGVDIFFVISGFLITGLVFNKVQNGEFAYLEFYERRVKRILPPLFFMMFLTLVVSYLIMLPYDYYKFNISVVSVLVFLSNFQYALRTGDYFSDDSSEWPLLHTWSLSVEEQYYFFIPIFIIFFVKFFPRKMNIFLVALGLLSFIVAEYLSRSGFSALSYYSIFTRMGELVVGSVLALKLAWLRCNIFILTSNLLAICALFIVLFLLFYVDKGFVFPGFLALLLCLSVALIIASENTIVNRYLANDILVYVGKLSYSLYLFHWPVFSLYRYLHNTSDNEYYFSILESFSLISLIVLLSFLSYKYVETPLRYLKLSMWQTYKYYLLLPSMIFVFIASVGVVYSGLPSRVASGDEQLMQYSHIDKSICPSLINSPCVLVESEFSKGSIIVYGNSHAEHYSGYMTKVSETVNRNLYLYASGGCTIGDSSVKCQSVYESFLADEHNEILVIAFRWDTLIDSDENLEKLVKLIETVKNKYERILVLGQPPVLSRSPLKVLNCSRLYLECDSGSEVIHNDLVSDNKIVKSIVLKAGADFFNPYDNLIDNHMYSDDGISYFYDVDHLSLYGSKKLYERSSSSGDMLKYFE